MLANKTRVRDGRGRPRKNTLKARKAPGQARSQETVGVILEASARILESDGLRGFNTNAIAAKAGVSIVWLANCYFARDFLGFPILLTFLDASGKHIPAVLVPPGQKLYRTVSFPVALTLKMVPAGSEPELPV